MHTLIYQKFIYFYFFPFSPLIPSPCTFPQPFLNPNTAPLSLSLSLSLFSPKFSVLKRLSFSVLHCNPIEVNILLISWYYKHYNNARKNQYKSINHNGFNKYKLIPALTAPPGELRYMWIGLEGFSDSRKSSWATTTWAVSSEIGPLIHTIRSFRRREKMS